MSYKSVPQECPTRVSHKSVPQECPIRVSHKSVLQESPTRVSYKSDPQECPTRVSQKSVPQECPTRVSFGHISFWIVFAFGFVGSILFLLWLYSLRTTKCTGVNRLIKYALQGCNKQNVLSVGKLETLM